MKGNFREGVHGNANGHPPEPGRLAAHGYHLQATLEDIHVSSVDAPRPPVLSDSSWLQTSRKGSITIGALVVPHSLEAGRGQLSSVYAT